MANISAASGFDFPDDGRGVGLVDWDLDGDQDVWIVNRSAPQIRFLRNDAADSGHFVSLALEGRTCNRDAIGARIELYIRGQSQPRIKTLRAGEGFLSQSSKRVHFGLLASDEIERLVVRWPGEERERFSGVKRDGHYRVVQGSGIAMFWSPPEGARPLVASEFRGSKTTDVLRVRLAGRFPLPRMEYETWQGRSSRLDGGRGYPRLIQLWASWCQPCLVELADLTEKKQQLADAGIDVLALSVDGLGDQKSDAEAAQAAIGRLKFSFTTGKATAAVADKLQAINDRIFDVARPLPLPTSFLLTAQGELAAIYKGPIDVQVLLGDVRDLETPASGFRERAVPFAGRWITEDDESAMRLALSELLMEMGLQEAAVEHLREAVRSAPDNFVARDSLGAALVLMGRGQEGVVQFRRALEIAPDDPGALSNLGLVLIQQGSMEEAASRLRHALRVDPRHAKANNNYGLLLYRFGRLEEAAQHFERTLEATPDDAKAVKNLAIVRMQQEKKAEAIKHFRRVLELSPHDEPSRKFLLQLGAE